MRTSSDRPPAKSGNEPLLLHAIRRSGPISRVALAELTGLSAQTVTNVVRRLLDAGLLAETGEDASGGPGRNPIRLELRPEGAYAVGFLVERDSLSMALTDFTGNIVEFERVSHPEGESPERTISRMGRFARAMRQSAYGGRIVGVGAGVPGPLDYERGEVLSPPNFSGWTRVPVRDWLAKEAQGPVVIDNSATVAAIGEHWQGKWGKDSFLYCYWGMGIGGGLVTGDRIYRGKSGNALEIGHTVVESNGRSCQCGGRGCLEAYASIPALLEEARPYGSFAGIGELVEAAKPGTALYAILVRAADYLAQAIVSAINLLDVELIVLGGEHIDRAGRLFVPIVEEVVRARAIRSKVAGVTVSVSSLKEEAGAIGAASLVFHELLLTQQPIHERR